MFPRSSCPYIIFKTPFDGPKTPQDAAKTPQDASRRSEIPSLWPLGGLLERPIRPQLASPGSSFGSGGVLKYEDSCRFLAHFCFPGGL